MPAEVEIPRWTAVLVTISAVLALGLLGWANTPHDTEDRPLFLSPERRAILRYLDAAERWAGRLAEVGELLDGLMPPAPQSTVESALPALPAPEEQPTDLYRRTHDGQEARVALESLARAVERAQVPDALVGLHSLVVRALEAHLAWADGMLAYVGAPDAIDHAELARLRIDALAALEDLEETLR